MPRVVHTITSVDDPSAAALCHVQPITGQALVMHHRTQGGDHPEPAALDLGQSVTEQARAVHRRTHGGDHPKEKPLLVAFFILDSIHKQSNTTLQAMLTLKVFS